MNKVSIFALLYKILLRMGTNFSDPGLTLFNPENPQILDILIWLTPRFAIRQIKYPVQHQAPSTILSIFLLFACAGGPLISSSLSACWEGNPVMRTANRRGVP